MRNMFKLFSRRVHVYKKPSDPPSNPEKPTIWNLIFGKYLLVTNTISSGLLMMIGDIASQEVEYYRGHKLQKEYDWRRIGCMTMVGLSQGPMHHFLYKWMDLFLPGTNLKTVFKKIIIDQTVMSPIFIVSYFYSAGLFEGDSLKQCTADFQDKFWMVYTADWCVWPPTQFLNFYLISPKYRVLYINSLTMLYNVFLCYIKHNDDLKFTTPLSTK